MNWRRYNFRHVKKPNIFTILISALLVLGLFRLYLKSQFFAEEKYMFVSVKLPYVAVHLDLKGAPPTLSYLESLLLDLKYFGANALLIEYEDMFPYNGSIVNISSPQHYKKRNLKKFLVYAKELGFEIIPLIQTFGHMEFALKLEEYQKLRELQIFPDVICPSKRDSLQLIEEILTQIITFHSRIVPLKHIHIGCNEVFSLNECYYCKHRFTSSTDLLLQHVKAIRKIIRKLSPGTKVLIWDDMLRNLTPEAWTQVHDMEHVEIVYWDSLPEPTRVNHSLMKIYREHFDNIWIASAFKGADGAESVVPVLRHRITSLFNWMDVIKSCDEVACKDLEVKGIALTGLSRYSHMEPICDLLPLSLPSLFTNLFIINSFRKGFNIYSSEYSPAEFYYNYVLNNINRHLECWNLDRAGDDYTSCRHRLVNPMHNHVKRFVEHVDSILKLYSTPNLAVYTKFDYVNIRDANVTHWDIGKHLERLFYEENEARDSMSRCFSLKVSDEYLGFKSELANKLLDQRAKETNAIITRRVWKRGRNISYSGGSSTIEFIEEESGEKEE